MPNFIMSLFSLHCMHKAITDTQSFFYYFILVFYSNMKYGSSHQMKFRVDWVYSSVEECLPCIYEAVGSIFSI